MRIILLSLLFIVGCTTQKTTDIVGTWQYQITENLVKNASKDKNANSNFDKNMEGNKLVFLNDSLINSSKIINGKDSVFQTGKYSIKKEGTAIVFDNGIEL
ncbi:MAG: hypothetical protein ACOVO1_08780, partial [Chitinophagaceae bacterium]